MNAIEAWIHIGNLWKKPEFDCMDTPFIWLNRELEIKARGLCHTIQCPDIIKNNNLMITMMAQIVRIKDQTGIMGLEWFWTQRRESAPKRVQFCYWMAEYLAWKELAELWRNPTFDKYWCYYKVTFISKRHGEADYSFGLCDVILHLWPDLQTIMGGKIEKLDHNYGLYVWPKTSEGIAPRVAYCEEQAHALEQSMVASIGR